MRMCRLALGIVLALAVTPSPIRGQVQAVDRLKASADELDQGQLLLQHREYYEALKRLTRANQLAGNRCVECTLSMAEAMQGMKAYQNVLDTAQRAIELAEGSQSVLARAHRLRGLAFQALGEKDPAKYRDAETAFRAALGSDSDPESRIEDDLHFNLGVVLLKLGRDEDGVAELKRQIETRSDSMADAARAMIANPRRARENYAPDFSIVSSAGETISLDALHGKVVLLDFWASWCAPCVQALPSIQKMQKAHAADPFVMVAFSADRDEIAWRRFTVKNAMVWPQYWDRTGGLQHRFGVRAIPTYVLLDREGIERVRVTGTGFNQSRSLSDAIEKQLSPRGSRD